MPASALAQTDFASKIVYYQTRVKNKNLRQCNRDYARSFLQGVSSIDSLYALAPLSAEALRLSLDNTAKSLIAKTTLRRHYLEFERIGIRHYFKYRKSLDFQIARLKGQYCALKLKLKT